MSTKTLQDLQNEYRAASAILDPHRRIAAANALIEFLLDERQKNRETLSATYRVDAMMEETMRFDPSALEGLVHSELAQRLAEELAKKARPTKQCDAFGTLYAITLDVIVKQRTP